MTENPKTRRRRKRDALVVSQMIAIHCAGCHKKELRTLQAYSGSIVCPECLALDNYAVEQTQHCKNIDKKTTCEECESRCYNKEMRAAIKEAMRYAGPRMIFKHPIAAIRHKLGK